MASAKKPRGSNARARGRSREAVPVDPTTVLLPLSDLTWELFEQFSEMFVQALSGGDVHRYGKRGEKQRGIDFYVDLPDGTRDSYQCRRYRKFTAANAQQAHKDKTFPDSKRHFVLVSCEVGRAVRDAFLRWKNWDILDVLDISREVAAMPLERQRRLLDTNFGPAVRRKFLGIPGVTTFVLSDEFFAVSASALLTHDLPLIGRRDSLEALDAFMARERRVALVTAAGGMGKTRLLKEVGERAEAHFSVRYVASGVPVTQDSYDELPLEPLLLVVDDAHLRNDLPLLLEIAKRHPQLVKIVIGARSHFQRPAEATLSRAGFDLESILVLDPLRELSRGETEELIRSLLPSIGNRDLAILASLAKDSPLIAVVTCRLMVRKSLDLSRLSRDEDVQFTILKRFEAESLGELPDTRPEDARALLRALAALGPANLEHPEVRTPLMTFLKLDQPGLCELLDLAAKRARRNPDRAGSPRRPHSR